ncbi:MAG: OsmC family protein [Pseudomonadota bacterium]
MATYTATIDWTLAAGEDFCGRRYSRGHRWHFDGGLVMPASPSPSIVPAPWSDAGSVDPEEAFVAALSSCHMLFFLSEAAEQGLEVLSYRDAAEGVMRKNKAGKIAVTRVTLRPDARYAGDAPPRDVIEDLHHRAHELCFIANSVHTDIVTDIIN